MDISLSFILLFGISGGEIFIILLLILVLFGPKKIPEIARTLGKGINEIKKVQRDINAEIHRYSDEIENPAKDIREDIEGFSKGLADSEYKRDEHAPSSDSTPKDETNKKDGEGEDDLPYPYNQAGRVTENAPEDTENIEGVKDKEDNQVNPSDDKKTD